MKKNTLLDLLSIFSDSREKLVSDFINESIEIYRPMFEYEENEELMTLAIEKYFIGYVNYHFELFVNYENIDEEFNKAMLSFIKKFNINVSDVNLLNATDLFSNLIQQKQNILEEIINIGNKDNNKYNQLAYSYQKDKTLFDREIRKYIEE